MTTIEIKNNRIVLRFVV